MVKLGSNQNSKIQTHNTGLESTVAQQGGKDKTLNLKGETKWKWDTPGKRKQGLCVGGAVARHWGQAKPRQGANKLNTQHRKNKNNNKNKQNKQKSQVLTITADMHSYKETCRFLYKYKFAEITQNKLPALFCRYIYIYLNNLWF